MKTIQLKSYFLLSKAFNQQKNANYNGQKELALRLCDEHSGTRRVDHIELLNRKEPFKEKLEELLQKLQISKQLNCLQVQASGTFIF